MRSAMSSWRSPSESEARRGRGSPGRLSWSRAPSSKAALRPRVNLSLRVSSCGCGVLGLHDFLDLRAEIRFERLRVLFGRALRVDVHERLVRVGEDLRPPSVAEHLDAVREIELAVAEAFRQQP